MRHLYVVTYDIADPKRWRRVFKTMRGFGDHLQLSVFLCDLPLMERVNMQAILHEVIHHEEDKVMIADLGPTEGRTIQSIETIGIPVEITKRGPKVV
jgi:CRISPR-associated protein Cas2